MTQQQEYQCSWCKRNKFNGDESCPLNLEGSNGNSDIFDGVNRVIKSCGCGSFIDTRRGPAPAALDKVDWVEEVRFRCFSYTEFYAGERAIRFDDLEGVIEQVKEERAAIRARERAP